MGYYVKTLAPCLDCGEATYHRRSHSRVPVCLRCGIGRMVHNMATQANASTARVAKEIKRDARRRRDA